MSYGKRKNLCNLIKLLALLLAVPLACFLFKAVTRTGLIWGRDNQENQG